MRKDQNFVYAASPLNYGAAIAFLNPFWNFNDTRVQSVVPALRFYHYMNPKGFAPEIKVDLKNTPEHIYPWLYDFDNPF